VNCFLDLLNKLVLVTVRAELVEAVFASAGCGAPTSRVSARRPTYFSLLRQRNLRKRKATRWSGTLRFAAGNLRCSTKAGSRSNSASPQTIASPDPLLPALLGPARRVGETNTNADTGRRGRALRVLAGARFRTRSRTHHPSGCAEERRSRRIRTGDCLSAASSSPAPAGPSTAGCPQRSGGTQTAGAPFLLLTFLLATQKKSELPPGNPRLAGSTSIASTGNGVGTRCRKTRRPA
jgi:hypothetical protein